MNKKSWIIVGSMIVIIVGLSSASYYAGFQIGLQGTKNIVVNYQNAETPADVTADFSLFWQAWDKLRERHIDGGTIPDQTLIYGAIKGLTNSYGDPNTNFFEPEDSKKFTEDISGNFGGIGAEIGIREKQLLVIAPLKNTPAEKAGLKANDKILEIDGKSTDGVSVNEAVKIIRGEIGTSVTLTISREEWEESRKIDITRSNIQVPVVEWKMKDDKIAHIQIFSFSGTTDSAFNRAVTEAILQGAKGIVLDLRNNPGGLLDTAVDIAGWFVPKGTLVVSEKFATGEEIIFAARGNNSLRDLPVVVIMNGGSASASEILAGALHIDRNVPLVGEHSFGKGTVQQLESLKDGSTLKITVAHWLLPDGTQIEKNGIAADYEVPLTEEDIKAERDPQLDKALELVKEKLK
ncbi:MAG: S41 family peptidase [bacterium]